MWIGIGIGIGAIVLIGIVMIFVYNNAAKKKMRLDNAFSQIRIQCRKKTELIPYLADVVKAHAKSDGIEIRLPDNDAFITPDGLMGAESQTARALTQLMQLAAKNPEIKLNAHFLQLQNELTSIEKAISFSRGFYNDAAMLYNRTVGTFPGNLICRLFRFKPAVFVSAEKIEDMSAIRGAACPACGAVSSQAVCPHCGTRIPLL